MKYIYLLRHADADIGDMEDFNRPLTPKGVKQVIKLSEKLSAKNLQIDKIIYSSSNRARQTFEYMAEFANKTEMMNKLYLASAGEIANIIAKQNMEINSLMIISHNPGIFEYLNIVAKNIPKKLRFSYDTCRLTKISFKGKNWQEFSPKFAQFEYSK